MKIEHKSIQFVPESVYGWQAHLDNLSKHVSDGWQIVGFSMATQYYGFVLLQRTTPV